MKYKSYRASSEATKRKHALRVQWMTLAKTRGGWEGMKLDAKEGAWLRELSLHHVTSQLYGSKATSTKQRGTQLPAEQLARWRYLGHHSQPSNTALWGTQQTRLAFQAHVATLRDYRLSLNMQSVSGVTFNLYLSIPFFFKGKHDPTEYEAGFCR